MQLNKVVLGVCKHDYDRGCGLKLKTQHAMHIQHIQSFFFFFFFCDYGCMQTKQHLQAYVIKKNSMGSDHQVI